MAVGGLLHAVQFARHRPEPIRQASLLMLLASGVSQADVLATTLRSLANESESPWADHIWQLILLMEQGYSLSRALATVKELLPEETVIAIRLAEESGTLEAVLSGEAARLLSQREQPATSSFITSAMTCAAVLTVMLGIVTFLMVFIIPKFMDIFEGFGMELPPLTQMLILGSESFYGIGVIAWMPTGFGLVGMCFVIAKAQTELLSQGRARLLDWRARHRSPTVLRLLSLTTATGLSLEEGLRHVLAEMSPSRAATQLSHVRTDVSGGAPLADSLFSRGFISSREARFLESATVSRHLDWALRHLATAVERRRQQSLARLGLLIPPAMILVVGGMVGFVVIAVFVPLVQLLSDLS